MEKYKEEKKELWHENAVGIVLLAYINLLSVFFFYMGYSYAGAQYWKVLDKEIDTCPFRRLIKPSEIIVIASAGVTCEAHRLVTHNRHTVHIME